MGAEIGNTYLETNTKERVCVISGSKFGPLNKHILTITKDSHGLRASGLHWHKILAD